MRKIDPITTRRTFLGEIFSAGALVLAADVIPAHAAEKDRPHDAFWQPSVYLGVEPDGTVIIIAHRSEMGQGSRTTLPMVAADELDADWKKVRIEQAVSDPRYGRQDTDGSRSTRDFFLPLRQAGATARMMLLRAAAEHWGVPVSECQADLHTVVHPPTKRRLGYGKLVPAASKLPVPKLEELQLKPKSAWRYMTKGVPSYDIVALGNGKAVFGMDLRVDGMVYASIEHPPVLGGKVRFLDDKETLKVPGVSRTVRIPPFVPPPFYQPLGGVAVIGDHTWATLQGRKKLKIDWDHGPNQTYNSEEYRKELVETVHKPCKVVRNDGDADAVFAKGGKTFEADYYVPLLAQAPMEPVVAVADYRDGKLTAWAPTQSPQWVQEYAAKQLGIAKEDVTCHVSLIGGAFGRKDKPDFVLEAAVLSKELGKPVKVVWTQEDNIKFSYYNSCAAMYMKAAVDERGMPVAWLQRAAFPPIPSTFIPDAVYGDPGHLGQGWTDNPFEIPNLRAENGPAKPHVRIGWMRSVAAIYQVFAICCFADELAHQAGRDSLDYLLDLIGKPRIVDLSKTDYPNYGAPYKVYPIDTARLRRVTEVVAEKGGWGKRKSGKGWGLGISAYQHALSYAATIVEVEVDDRGNVRIPRVESAVDCGIILDPDRVRAQMEGSAVFAASIVRSGEITATNGVINQSNYHDYPVARIKDAPFRTNVHLVDSDALPTGVGEPAIGPFIAAFCNALHAATGKPIRELPITKQKLV